MDISTLVGSLVAATAREFSFVDKVTRQKVEGVSYLVYVVTEFDSAPVEVKVRQDDVALYNDLYEAGYDAGVSIEVRLDAQATANGAARIVRTLVRVLDINTEPAADDIAA